MRISRLLPFAAALVSVACGDDKGELDVKVEATDNQTFSPATATISVGGTVTWGFHSVGHSVIFDGPGAPADIPGVNINIDIARVFPTAGILPYHCAIHPTMTGDVVVEEPSLSIAF